MNSGSAPKCAAAIVLVAALTAVTPGTAHADEVEQVKNGTFDSTTDPWWSTPGMPMTLTDGQACVDVPGGTANAWDVAIGQNDIPLVKGQSYRFTFTTTADHPVRAIVGLAVAPYDTYFEAPPAGGTFTSAVDTTQGQVAFQLGGSPDPWHFCLDNVSLSGGVPPDVYVPDTGPRVRVNQVAYLPQGPKNGTLVTDSTTPLPWQLHNGARATGGAGAPPPPRGARCPRPTP